MRNILILDVLWPLAYGAFLPLLPLYAFADQTRRRRRALRRTLAARSARESTL